MSESNQEKMISILQEQQAHWMTLTSKVLENSMKLFELNVRMAKESLDDSSNTMQHLFKVKAPEEMFDLDAEKMQDKMNRMLSYAKEMNEITADLNAELCQMTQSQWHEACAQAAKLVEDVRPVVPEQNQQPFNLMMSALESASKNYEQWMGMSQKMMGEAERNVAGKTKPVAAKKKRTK